MRSASTDDIRFDAAHEPICGPCRRSAGMTKTEETDLVCNFPSGFLLSVVVPFYNEQGTLRDVVERIRATKIPVEIILVDDGSSDGSLEIASQLAWSDDVVLLTHPSNRGKGAALRTGFLASQGDIVIVQDADLEYDPQEFSRLLVPLLDDTADVVFGSRYLQDHDRRADGWHYRVNGFITWLSNLRTRLNLTDVETCYKVFRSSVVQQMAPQLQESGFGVEIEIASRLSKMKVRIVELPITYRARSYAEGKKINWRDGLRAIWCAFRY